MLLNEKQFKAIKSLVPQFKHQNGAFIGSLSQDIIPCCWTITEILGDLHLAEDSGHGLIAGFKGDNLLLVGRHELVTSEAVFLDKEVYGAIKGIWV